MHTVQPASLTTKELLQHADFALLQGTSLPVDWQKELVYRLDCAVSDTGHTPSFNPQQLSLF